MIITKHNTFNRITTRTGKEYGKLCSYREQDCETIVENNKALQNSTSSKATRRYPHDLAKQASIPNIFFEKWLREDGVNLFRLRGKELDKYLRKKLNGEYTYLRTVPWDI